MNEKQSNITWEAMLEDIRLIVREEIRTVLNKGNAANESFGPPAPFLTVRQAAEASSLASSTVRLLIRKGQLKAYHVGRRVMIKRNDLDQFLESHPTRTMVGVNLFRA